MPSSLEPLRFYKSRLCHFQDLHAKFGSLPDDLSCKNLYSFLHELPRVAPGCAGFWEAGYSRPINWQASVWRKSRLKLIENRKNDLIWLIIHRVVRTRSNLMNWGYIGMNKCSLCTRTETIEHCFLECPRVRTVWKLLAPILSRFPRTSFTISPLSVFYSL